MEQTRTKDRVVKYGEVFTAEKEVNAMCDLVREETERVDSRFLEPACGDGNFLVEILRRKLEHISTSEFRYKCLSFRVLDSIYGIDILQDNVDAARRRMFNLWAEKCRIVCGKVPTRRMKDQARSILEKNIVCGNFLTGMLVDENQQDTEMPISFLRRDNE